MKTLIIYDDNGSIFSSITGNYELPQGGIQYLELTIPDGKQVTSIDVSATPHQAILEDIPPSEIDVLKQRIAETDALVLSLIESMYS